jgi:hypothetical protein
VCETFGFSKERYDALKAGDRIFHRGYVRRG